MSIKSIIFVIIEKILSQCTDAIVCISKAEKQSALKEHIANESKIKVIENGIDISSVRSAEPLDRESLGIPSDSYVVGMIGRLETQKAPDTFIHAAKLIQEDIPNSFFIIVGNGDQTDEIQNYAKENNIRLIVTGWVDNPYSYLKLFDVALLLSRWEGFGLAIVEYMAAEKNIVATRVDAIPTLVDDGVDGFLVDMDSPEQVHDKVVYIHSHPDEAKLMRMNALKKVYEKYDIQRVADEHLRLFRQILTE